jgi:hypothetical protein
LIPADAYKQLDATAEVQQRSRLEEADLIRWIIYVFLGLVGLLLAVVVAVYLLIGHLNLAPIMSRRVSAALGRQVTIGALHVTPGRWSAIEADAVRVANVAGGSRPTMVNLDHLTAEIDTLSLFRRPFIARLTGSQKCPRPDG